MGPVLCSFLCSIILRLQAASVVLLWVFWHRLEIFPSETPHSRVGKWGNLGEMLL